MERKYKVVVGRSENLLARMLRKGKDMLDNSLGVSVGR